MAGRMTNSTDAPLEWTETFDMTGTVTSSWEAEFDRVGDVVTVSGVNWNDVLAPGRSANFGFCASGRPATN